MCPYVDLVCDLDVTLYVTLGVTLEMTLGVNLCVDVDDTYTYNILNIVDSEHRTF